MNPTKISPEYTGIYFPRPEGDGLFFKNAPHTADMDRDAELFNKMMSEPMSPAKALQLQAHTYEKALPWQVISSVTRNALSGVQSLMNGQV